MDRRTAGWKSRRPHRAEKLSLFALFGAVLAASDVTFRKSPVALFAAPGIYLRLGLCDAKASPN
jgi:hypothetical protein